MSTADLLVIIIVVILTIMNDYYFPVSFLYITPVCSSKIVLMGAATNCSVWFTIAFSFDRFVAICCQKLKTKCCTGKKATVVLATTGMLVFLKNIPFYFTEKPIFIFNNVPWGCQKKASIYFDARWVGFQWFDKVTTPLLPFGLILLVNALTVRHIVMTSRVRQGLMTHSKGQNYSDREMESRRKSMILLFSISGTFILFWSVNVITFLYVKVIGLFNIGEFVYTLERAAAMLLNLNCCTNTFIYVVTQAKFRDQIKLTLKYPFKAIAQRLHQSRNSAWRLTAGSANQV
ncbi:probable G-protein coupled receptor 139 [Scyliorhinus canicula]|uniref:probable G-protein coupled receptor 139 n=1 Tax=Scyliorhinus canicula TaxID=7830 RepID=UPI0018F549EF|nr:probable G-protein coupled receptor 139 [Scyliorhinus canicula]